MLELLIGVGTLIAAIICLYLLNERTTAISEKMTVEGDLMKENMNHIASALVGLSELLDDADEIIENASQIPTAGEMLMQVVQSMIMQKLSPAMMESEIQPLIGELVSPPAHGPQEEIEATQENG